MIYLAIGLACLAGSILVLTITVAIDSRNQRILESRRIDEEYHLLCLSEGI